jgi:hypothetical protein
MLSDFNTRFRMVGDCEQSAINLFEHRAKQGHASPYGEAEYHVQGYAGEGKTPHDIVIGCRVSMRRPNNRRVHTFTLQGKRIARHKIALRLGELGV